MARELKGLQKYTIQKQIGQGVSGFVLSCLDSNLNPVAVKCLYKNRIPFTDWMRDRKLGTITREIFIMRKLHHPGIIQFIEKLEDHDFFYIVMEQHGLASNNSCRINHKFLPLPTPPLDGLPTAMSRKTSTDLFEFISRHEEISEDKIKYIFKQICEAVNYLHSQNIVHNDIKDENIVINDKYIVKLIDFGASDFIPERRQDYFMHYRGTLHYTPPEVLRNEPFRGPETDVWALGILLFLMAHSFPPFRTQNDIRNLNYHPTIIKRSEDLDNLIHLILQEEPEQRPTVEEILEHDWFMF